MAKKLQWYLPGGRVVVQKKVWRLVKPTHFFEKVLFFSFEPKLIFFNVYLFILRSFYHGQPDEIRMFLTILWSKTNLAIFLRFLPFRRI